MTLRYIVQKRVANTECWKCTGYEADEYRDAKKLANKIEGAKSTGVRICDTRDPYSDPILIAGC